MEKIALPRPKKNRSFALVAAIMIFGAGLRLHHLGDRPLYWDEPFLTVDVASRSLSFITTTNYGSNLYPLILHFIMPLGRVELMARLPAALFGIFSILGIYLVGKILFGRKEGVLAALLLALSTHNIYFSQQARGYTGLMFFSLFSLYFLLRALRAGRAVFWGLYALCSVAGIYMHFFFLVQVPVHAVFVAAFLLEDGARRRRLTRDLLFGRTSRRFAASVLAVLVLSVLLFLPERSLEGAEGANRFIASLMRSIANLFKAQGEVSFIELIGTTVKRQLDYASWPAYFYAKLALFVLGVIVCLLRHRKELVLIGTFIILPFSLFILTGSPRLFLPVDNKYIFIAPVLILGIARGIMAISSVAAGLRQRLRRRPGRLSPGTVVFAFLLPTVVLFESVSLSDYRTQFWRFRSLSRDVEVDSFLRQEVQKGDMVFFDGFANKSVFLFAEPVIYPSGVRKGFMIYEDEKPSFMDNASATSGLWAVFDRNTLDNEARAELAALSGGAGFRDFSRYSLLYIKAGDGDQASSLERLLEVLLNLPGKPEKAEERLLLLAKTNFLAGRDMKALDALAHLDVVPLSVFPGLPEAAKKDNPLCAIRGFFNKDISEIQAENRRILMNQTQELLQTAALQQAEAGDYKTAFLWLETAGRLGPPGFRLFLTKAALLESQGMKEQALREYEQALLLSRVPEEESAVLRKIGELRGLTSGYFLRRSGDVCRLRWWSNQQNDFSGVVEARSIKKAKGFRLNRNDRMQVSRNRVNFQGTAGGGRVEGLDIILKNAGSLTFSLKIDNKKSIADRIIIFGQEKNLQSATFSLD